jgi:hypothetical protein
VALLISGCAKDKAKTVQPARDGNVSDAYQRSDQLFEELEGKADQSV